jgi:FkbM family methyltransferase
MSLLSADTLTGQMLRLPLRLIPHGTVIPILGGPAKGMRWIVGAHIHGCWLGTYERDIQKAFASHLKPGMTVYDIGANAGIYTLIAASCVGASGRVCAFEPVRENIGFLSRHVTLNRLGNCELINAGVFSHDGRMSFSYGKSLAQGSLAKDTDGKHHLVDTVKLDTFIRTHKAPNVIKIDVEGAECDVLIGASTTLEARPTTLIAMHDGNDARCREIMDSYGYKWEQVGPTELLFYH